MAAVLALLAPLLFLHVHHQPTWSVGLGSTSATLSLSDLAVLGILAAAAVDARRRGLAPLRRARPILVAGAAFLLFVALSIVWGSLRDEPYRTLVHTVSAGKLAEYALLALAVPLLVRQRRDAMLLLATLTAWSVAATFVGLLQFLGLADEPTGRRPGQREPSFVGYHDFAALSGAAVGIALAAIALGPLERRRERVAAVAAGVAGTLGVVLSGAAAGAIGVLAAAAVAAAFALLRGRASPARLAGVAAVAAAVVAGVVAMRTVEFDPVLEAIGIEPSSFAATRVESDSYRQRVALAYIGGRMFADNPALGVGWLGSSEEPNYAPYLEDARRRYPSLPERALPSPEHPWGIQNAYIQAAAELGVLGLVLFLGVFAVGLVVAVRATLRAPPAAAAAASIPALWLLVTMGVWIGLGIVAGIPLVGLQWLSLGLAGAAAAWEGLAK